MVERSVLFRGTFIDGRGLALMPEDHGKSGGLVFGL